LIIVESDIREKNKLLKSETRNVKKRFIPPSAKARRRIDNNYPLHRAVFHQLHRQMSSKADAGDTAATLT